MYKDCEGDLNASSVLYATRFTKLYILRLSVSLLLPFLKHSVRSPFFGYIPEINWKFPDSRKKPRWRLIFYSVMYELLLDGFLDVTDIKIESQTKRLLFLMIDVIKGMDDTIDEVKSSSLEEFLRSSPFQERWSLLKRFLSYYDKEELIGGYLKDTFRNLYPVYMDALTAARSDHSFQSHLRVIEIDSKWLPITMKVIAIFNGTRLTTYIPHPEVAKTVCVKQFETNCCGI